MLSSVSNALRVLDFLGEEGEGGVSEIGRALDLNPGTVHRLLSTLRETGYADQDPKSKKYLPGTKLLRIASRMRERLEFLDLAHRHFEALVERGKETVNFGVLRGRNVVYLDRVLSKQPLAVEVKIGAQVPAYCTALGKAILAHAELETREDYFVWLADAPSSDRYPVPNVHQFRKELDEVRSQGHAEDLGAFSPRSPASPRR